MDPSGRYTTQQRIKIIEAYFAAKSVLLTQRQCRKDFGRNSVPNGRTIQHLVAKFQKTGSVGDAHKGQDCSSFGTIPENIQNLWQRHEDFPKKSTGCLSKETGIFRILVLRILHHDLKHFPYKNQILQRQTDQNKAERGTILWRYQSKDSKWPWLVGFERLEQYWPLWTLRASAILPISRNLATKRWMVLLSGTLSLSKSLLHCRCVSRNNFVAKYA